MYQAGLQAGLTDAAARVMAAQAAIESGYGERAPGNNYFAITKGADWNGPTISRTDKDAAGNPKVQQFRVYDTPAAGLADRVAYMNAHFPGFNQAKDIPTALSTLQKGVYGKYYEAPQARYEKAVNGIIKTNLAAGPPAVPKSLPPPSALPALPSAPASGPNIIDITKGGKVGKYAIPPDAYASQPRAGKITGIVFHHTGGDSLAGAIGAGQKGGAQPGTGSTFYIDTDGSIYRYAPDNVVRVGIRNPGGKYRTDKGKPTAGLSNDDTISIEVVAPDSNKFTTAQKNAAASLGQYLSKQYKIDPSMIVGHGDIQGGPGGNKQPTEGVQLAQLVRNQIAGLRPPQDIPGTPLAIGNDFSRGVTGNVPPPLPRPRPTLQPGLQSIPQSASFGVNDPGSAPAMSPGLEIAGRPTVIGGRQTVPRTLLNPDLYLPKGTVDPIGPGLRQPVAPASTYGQPPITQQQTLNEQRMMRGVSPAPAAIPSLPGIPMPGRPAALQTGLQAPTVPPAIPRMAMAPPSVPAAQSAPAMQRQAAPQQQLVRLASGQMIPVGIQQGSNGPLNITDDGRGNAVITKIRNPGAIPGVIDPIKEASSPTLAGAFIRAKIPEVMGDALQGAQQNLGYAGDAIKSNAVQAVNNIGQGAQNVAGTIGNAFGSLGSLFGGPPSVPKSWSPWGNSVMRQPSGGVPPIPQSRPMFAPQQQAAAFAPSRSTGQAGGGTIYDNPGKYGSTQAERQAAAAQRAAFLAQWGG